MGKITKLLDERRRSRIKQTAEVFTPIDKVNTELNKLPINKWENGKTFIDPSCGNGNWLVEILKRKLKLGHNPTASLKTIFGVDIMRDNIRECRQRLLKIISDYEPITEEHIKTVMMNIVLTTLPTKEYPEKGFPEGALNYLDPKWMREHNKKPAFSYSPKKDDIQEWLISIEKGDFFKEDLPVRTEKDAVDIEDIFATKIDNQEEDDAEARSSE